MNTQSDKTPTAYDDKMLEKAEAEKIFLEVRRRGPDRIVTLQSDPEALHGVAVKEDDCKGFPYVLSGKGSSVILDFGEHMVGRMHFRFNTDDNPQDAPIRLRFRFGEVPSEIYYSNDDYNGWFSDTWFQDEIRFIDCTPAELALGRRYSFRYLEIELLGISPKNSLILDSVTCVQQSSAGRLDIEESVYPNLLGKIDEVSRRTLRDCMQEVFEDGPKRDRRLWLGDLRLQALSNYDSYRNYSLVRRCLYLFAGTRDINGRIASCLFMEPVIRPDTIYLFDYYLLFVPTLLEYFEACSDRETLEELWPAAKEQIRIGIEAFENIPAEDKSWWAFIDWHPDLDKVLPALGILIYCIKAGITIAEILGDSRTAAEFERVVSRLCIKAEKAYDPQLGVYLGKGKQISYAGQIWMILSGAAGTRRAKRILTHNLVQKYLPITTPYLMHYYVEALLVAGLKEKAAEIIEEYWGGMVKHGADTFWEIYQPDDLFFSPYGSFLVNSYCHAWSCTPIWLLKQLDRVC